MLVMLCVSIVHFNLILLHLRRRRTVFTRYVCTLSCWSLFCTPVPHLPLLFQGVSASGLPTKSLSLTPIKDPRTNFFDWLNQSKLSLWNFCRSRCGALHNLLYCPVTINLLCPIVKLRPLFTLESTWLNLYYPLKKSARISRRNYTDLTAGAYAIQLSPLPLAPDTSNNPPAVLSE